MGVTRTQQVSGGKRVPNLGSLRKEDELKKAQEAAINKLQSDLGEYLQALKISDVQFVISPVSEAAILIDEKNPQNVIELLESATRVADVDKIMDQIAHAFLSKLNVWEKILCTIADGPSIDYDSPTHRRRVDEYDGRYPVY